ncbi:hypothetical protein BGX34_003444 [Mortierella sp. NVP85]|nr:hypothetical protein BGX34_003444 [Mortierella sp. NVP85]
MKFITVATAIAATVLYSVIVEAYRDVKCYDQDMRLSKYQSIQCDRFQIRNTCGKTATITQPTAGNWVRVAKTFEKVGCFQAVFGDLDYMCLYDKEMRLHASQNIICGKFNIKNTCSTEETLAQPENANWIRDLYAGRGKTTLGCFQATPME